MEYRSYAKYIAVIITIVLLVLLFTQINIGDIINTLKSINPIYLIAGFILYICTYFFRSWRFHVLLNKEVSIKKLFFVVCVQNMMNNILPSRIGELSYVYLLKKVNDRTTGEGVATLVVARIFDFLIVIILFFIATIFTQNLPTIIKSMIWFILFLLLFLIATIFFLYYSDHPMTILNKILKIVHLDKRRIGIYLLNKGEEVIISLKKIQSKWKYTYVFLISFPIWFSNYLIVFLLLLSINQYLPVNVVILGSTFSLISTLLPIGGIAGFGTQESFWGMIFVPLGLTVNDAIISGFVVHIVVLVYCTILWIPGIIFINRK